MLQLCKWFDAFGRACGPKVVLVCQDKQYRRILTRQIDFYFKQLKRKGRSRIVSEFEEIVQDIQIQCVVYFFPAVVTETMLSVLPMLVDLPTQPSVLLVGCGQACTLAQICAPRFVRPIKKHF